MTDHNQLDMSFQWINTPELDEKYHMVGPLRTGKTFFFVTQESPIQAYNSLDDLRHLKFGTIAGYRYSEAFDNAILNRPVSAYDYRQLIKILLGDGRVDLIIGDLHSVIYSAQELGVRNRIRKLPKIHTAQPRYVAFPKQKAKKAQRFAAGLAAIRASGKYDEIMKKWE